MNTETNFPWHKLKELTNYEIKNCFALLVDELHERNSSNIITHKEKEEICSIIYMIKSKFYFLEKTMLSQSVDPANHTPSMGNLLSVGFLMKDYAGLSPDRKNYLDDFVSNFIA